jgi:predicted amidohydrolase
MALPRKIVLIIRYSYRPFTPPCHPGFWFAFFLCWALGNSAAVAQDLSRIESPHPPPFPDMNVTSSPKPFPEGPRKAVIGTTLFSLFESERPWISVQQRLSEIRQRIDELAADAQQRYGKGLDLVVFPENAINPRGRGLMGSAIEFTDEVRTAIASKAKEHNTYVVVSFNMIEDRAQETVYNVAVLFDRQGAVAAIYKKVFCLAPMASELLEGGRMPGTEFPVFDTDFARIGFLICWDMTFPHGLESYAASGVELIVWPTMSPQTVMPRLRCRQFGFHLVSSTPRANASIFDPTGNIVAQVLDRDGVVTHEIDFDYRILHWQDGLNNGDALRAAYGDRVGFRYSEVEDTGIFWSNDSSTPIGQMLSETGLASEEQMRQHTLRVRESILRSAVSN